MAMFFYFAVRYARFFFFGKTNEDRRDSVLFMGGFLANVLLSAAVDASSVPALFLGIQLAIFVSTIVWDLRKGRRTIC